MTTTLDRAADVRGAVPPQAAASSLPTSTAQAPDLVPGHPAHRRPTYEGTKQISLHGALSGSDRSWLGPELEDLVASGARTVQLDLFAVTHVDPLVVRLLLSTSWRLAEDERDLVLVRAPRKVRHIIRWHGAGDLLAR